MPICESLDYHSVHNKPCIWREKHTVHRTYLGIKQQTIVKLTTTLAIGILTGCLAVGMAILTEHAILLKNSTVRSIIHDGRSYGVLRGAIFHCVISSVLTVAGVSMVQWVAPAAAGAGTSLVIAYLNGNAVPDLLSWRSLLVKWAGTICSVSANLTFGPEAPMVHLGACTAQLATHFVSGLSEKWQQASQQVQQHLHKDDSQAAQIAQAVSQPLLGHRRPPQVPNGEGQDASEGPEEEPAPDKHFPLPMFASDQDKREFICAGAAAGIAAAFGAPIGGVLFSLEEASTVWSRKMAWRCFICTTVAVFTLAQLHPRWRKGVLSFEGVTDLLSTQWFAQLPFLILVSCGGGLIGALFNYMRQKAMKVRPGPQQAWRRLAQGVGVAVLTIGTMFTLSYLLGRCVDVPAWRERNYGYTFHCPSGLFNDLATLFLSNPDDTIKHIFSLGNLTPHAEVCQGENCYFTLRSLAILSPAYLLLMAAGASLTIPGGLFMPSIMVGGSFGGVCGLLLMSALPSWDIQPGVYAMCASAAVLGGVFRSSISLVVLLVEGTQSTKFMLGIITAVIASNWLGDLVHSDGIYESDLEADGSVVYLRQTAPSSLTLQPARQIMSSETWSFGEIESVAFIEGVLRRTLHNGFPVVNASARDDAASTPESRTLSDLTRAAVGLRQPDRGCTRKGPLKGLVLRSQLLVLLAEQAFCDEHGTPQRSSCELKPLERQLCLDRKMRTFYRDNFSHRQHLELDNRIFKDMRAKQRLKAQEGLSRHGSGSSSNGHPANGHATPSPEGSLHGSRQYQKTASREAFEHSVLLDSTDIDAESLAQPQAYVDLRPFMDVSPPNVRGNLMGEDVHAMFVSQGLRHLIVVNDASWPQGMITRHDLDVAAGPGGYWRRSKVAPQLEQLPAQLRLRSVAHAVRRSYSNLAKLVIRSPQAVGWAPSPAQSPMRSASHQDSNGAGN